MLTSLTSVQFEDASILQTIKGTYEQSFGEYHKYGAFSGCEALTSIEIPASVRRIEAAAFQDCSSLQSVTFQKGSSLLVIGRHCFDKYYFGAFSDCTSLKSIEIPASVTTIEVSAFSYCSSLGTVTFEQGSKLEAIEGRLGNVYHHGAFAGCSRLTIDASNCTYLENIGEAAFYYCKLTLFKIKRNSPPSCGSQAFSGIGSAQLQVPSGSIEAYRQAAEWKNFSSISALD